MGKENPAPPLVNPPERGAVYKHYKGDRYQVIDVALHSETSEWMVVYKPLYECDVQLFVRPLSMWHEAVEWEGARVPRFVQVS